MGNTVFFESAKVAPEGIKWKDILSESKQKHSKEELEYAFTAGMLTNRATEADMLRKWHKPWVFRRVAIYGISLVAFVYAVFFFLAYIGGLVPIAELLTVFIPPFVIPLAIVIFLWELNIPKNITIIDVLSTFVIGGILSIVLSMVINTFVLKQYAEISIFAGLSEEPGKFLAALLFLAYFSLVKKKRIYGMTGVIIGAAVGAGFSAFETVQYVFNGEMEIFLSSYLFGGGIGVMIERLIGSFGNHTLFCAMYTGCFALALSKKKRFSPVGFFNGSFWLYFVMTIFMHAIWNGITIPFVDKIFCIAQVLVQWYFFLKIVTKCLNQMVVAGTYVSGTGLSYQDELGILHARVNQAPAAMPGTIPQPGAAVMPGPEIVVEPAQEQHFYSEPEKKFRGLNIYGEKGALSGLGWSVDSAGEVVIGRGDGCAIKFPSEIPAISRMHCKLNYINDSWYVQDLNSTNGTFINGNRIEAGSMAKIDNEINLGIAGEEHTLRILVQ